MQCPKCGSAQADDRAECARCGVVFAKYDPNVALAAARRRVSDREDRRAGRRALLVVAVGILGVGAAFAAWSLRPMPHRWAVRPAALGAAPLFEGIARGYTGERAPIELVDGGEMTRVEVGTIEPDGHFRFQLPADPGVPMPAKPYPHAGHRFNVEFWVDLAVVPDDAIAVQYHLQIPRSDGISSLVLTNTDLEWVAGAGDVMALFAWADQPARVDAVSGRDTPFPKPIRNPWQLALSPGWNLVSSVQQDDGVTIRYESAPLPKDLEWNVVAAQ